MKKQYSYAAVSILLWSTIATVSKLLLGSLDTMQVMTVSSLFAFLFLLIWCGAKGLLHRMKDYRISDYLKICGIGLLGTFFYNLFLWLGIDSMQASRAFIINYLWPIMTVVFAVIILKERMTVRKALAILTSFLGVVIVTSNGSLEGFTGSSLSGTLFCVLAAMSYGLFAVLNKKNNYDKFIVMMIANFAAFVISLIYQLVSATPFDFSGVQIAGLAWSGIFTCAIANTTWSLALDSGDTAKISNLAYITPFLSLIWTWLVLGEKLNVYSILGLVVIVLGIFVQMKKKDER